jgi:hypothetical protein
MEEMQSIAKQIETNRDDLEAWQRMGELVDDLQKKNDCRDQVARIKKESAGAGMPVGLPADPADSFPKDHVTANLLWDQLPLIAILASNLLPIIGILFLHWSLASVLALYWAENVMVGFFTILKMAFADSQAGNWQVRLVMIILFCFHFGGFCFVHAMFLVGFLFATPRSSQSWNWWLILAGLWLPILGMFISYSISFYRHYLGDGDYQRVTLTSLMAEPYPRIIPMHVGLIMGGFFVLALGSPIGILLVLVALKTGFELVSYRRSVAKWRNPVAKIQALQG